MSANSNSCHSCFVKYDNKTRQAKMLQCFHTYCKQCLEQYMYNKGVVTCLSCGKETSTPSVDNIPDNPYIGQAMQQHLQQGKATVHSNNISRGNEDSGNGEELYYSDSDEDDISADSSGPATSTYNDGSTGNPTTNGAISAQHIEGIKAMVLNTQRANVGKIQQLNQQIISKIQQIKSTRSQKEARINESLQAIELYKDILKKEQKSMLTANTDIEKYEARISKLQLQLSKINLLQFPQLKSIHDECLALDTGLKDAIEKNERLMLEDAVRQSILRINFDAANDYVKQLGAEKDTIYMKLCTALDTDPSMVYLTTYMLANIFTEKIATNNDEFKEQLEAKLFEMNRSLPGPLDDPTEYIDYIEQFKVQQHLIQQQQQQQQHVINHNNNKRQPPPQQQQANIVDGGHHHRNGLASATELAKLRGAASVGSSSKFDSDDSRSDSPAVFGGGGVSPSVSGGGAAGSSPTATNNTENWKVVSKANKKEAKKPAAATTTPAAPGGGGMTLSFSDMAKKPGDPNAVRILPTKRTVGATNRPRCFFKIQIDNQVPFRVVFEMRPDMAPKMCDNFIKLCQNQGPDGVGYKGSKIFRAKADDHILGGDFEFNDGTGGFSAFEEKYFMAEQCPLKDHKGAIRMKGLERTADGRCKVGSQFMIWVGDLEYKEYRFTLVFGEVVEGFQQLQDLSKIKAVQKSPNCWILRQNVQIVDSGVL